MKISQLSALAFIPIALLQLLVVQAQLLTDTNAQNLNTALGQKVQYTFLDAGSSNDQLLHLPSTTPSSSVITNSLAMANFTGSSSFPVVTSSVISSIDYQSANSTITTQLTTSPSSSANYTTSSHTTKTIGSSTSTGAAGSIKPCFYFVVLLETIAYLFS